MHPIWNGVKTYSSPDIYKTSFFEQFPPLIPTSQEAICFERIRYCGPNELMYFEFLKIYKLFTYSFKKLSEGFNWMGWLFDLFVYYENAQVDFIRH